MPLETSEVQVSEVNENVHQSSVDVMGSYAANAAKRREAKIVEEPKTAETTAEIKNEAPKETNLNGQAEKPIEEVKAPAPADAPAETDWRKELGFDDTIEVKAQETKENTKDFKSEYEQTAKELAELNNDTFIAAYNAAKKAGKDIPSFIREVAGVDVNSLTPEQIWDANLKAEGFTPEEIATDMEKFRDLSPVEQKLKVKPFKQELITQQQENLKKYASDSALNTEKSEKDRQALVVAFNEQGKQFFNKIKDKEWQGIKWTSSEINKLENFLEKDFNYKNADGSLNYEMYAKDGNYALNERTILQNTYKKGETKGYEKALLEIARPSNNDKRFNSAPDLKTTNKSDRAKEAQRMAFNPS
jgi:hypothetical protein